MCCFCRGILKKLACISHHLRCDVGWRIKDCRGNTSNINTDSSAGSLKSVYLNHNPIYLSLFSPWRCPEVVDYFLNGDGLCNRRPERIIELLHLFQKMRALLAPMCRVCDCASVCFPHLWSTERELVSVRIKVPVNGQVQHEYVVDRSAAG